MERLSVDSYKLVFPELDIDEVRFLVCDEYTTLAQVYLRCRDYANAQSALAREEGILCDDIKDQANKLRAGRALVSIRLYEARMFRAQNKLAEASEKYRQCIAAGEAISSTNIELDKSRFALALASAHKELVDCIVGQRSFDQMAACALKLLSNFIGGSTFHQNKESRSTGLEGLGNLFEIVTLFVIAAAVVLERSQVEDVGLASLLNRILVPASGSEQAAIIDS